MLSNNNNNNNNDNDGDLEEITVPSETPDVKYFLHTKPPDDDDAEDPTAADLYGFETNQ